MRHGGRLRALGRPLAVGLLVAAGLAPAPPETLPRVLVRPAEALTPVVAAEKPAWMPAAAPLVLARAEPKTEVAPEPVRLPAAPAELTVAPAPGPVPSVTPPAAIQLALLAKARRPKEIEGAGAPAIVLADPPALAAAPVPRPLPVVTPPAAPTLAAPLRRVDIAQIGENTGGVRVAQLHEPGLVPGGPTLADKTAAMQVVLPPPARLSEQELALLQGDAPAELTVRIGREAMGKVAFRMSESRTIDVQLSGLLDVLADRFAPEDYARLRSAAAADSFVPVDNLRSIGLGLRYDPVYDELRVSA